MEYCMEQSYRCNDRHGQWNDNLEQDANIRSTIHLCRFLQLCRDTLEEILDDDQVERADCRRDDVCPKRVKQSCFPDDQIGRDHPSAEQHREHHEKQDNAAAFNVRLRQWISHQAGQENVYKCSDHRPCHTDPECPEEMLVHQHLFIGEEGGLDREKDDLPRNDGTLAA